MTWLDKLIRAWRIKIALKAMPINVTKVYDIGCDNGYLYQKIKHLNIFYEGSDPRLKNDLTQNKCKLKKGYFPEVLDLTHNQTNYDVIFALAVFEHFNLTDLQKSASVINQLLSPNGRLIITIPQPIVDKILDLLSWFELIKGQALEEHHGLKPIQLVKIFEKELQLIKWQKFQGGLNNLLIFAKKKCN